MRNKPRWGGRIVEVLGGALCPSSGTQFHFSLALSGLAEAAGSESINRDFFHNSLLIDFSRSIAAVFRLPAYSARHPIEIRPARVRLLKIWKYSLPSTRWRFRLSTNK